MDKKLIEPFNKHVLRYETWFNRYELVYKAELRAVRELLPNEEGIEIGVGSGRFAAPLGIKFGLDPSIEMLRMAKNRDIDNVMVGVGEAIPLNHSLFSFVLMVTTICFLYDLRTALKEAFRILKPGGSLIIGFINSNSPLGEFYQEYKEGSVFYRVAKFYSVEEVIAKMREHGFLEFNTVQTIFRPLQELTSIEPVKDGHDEGSFIVIRAKKEHKKGATQAK